MIRSSIILFTLLALLFSCSEHPENNEKGVAAKKSRKNPDYILDRVLTSKKIIAATDYGSVNYLIYRGEPIGYQYELLQNFAAYLGVEVEMVITEDIINAHKLLQDNKIDLIAMGLTVTQKRRQKFEFTDPIDMVSQVLVQAKPENYRKMRTADEIESHLIRNQVDLANKTVYVQKGTIFIDRLKTLANEIAGTITVIEEEKDVEELIAAVASGEIDYTIADEHIALINQKYYPNIDVKTPISFPQQIAWAVKKGQTGMRDTINSWLDEFNNSLLSRLIYNKYFKNIRSARIVKSEYNSFSGGHLSPYDEFIKAGSKIVGWDWRLLASMIYQESQFKPNVRSWVGAYGLMQMMPHTFELYGIDTTATPKKQIIAGSKYLKHLDEQLPEEITNKNERIKFTLASYNSGIGHILDARRLAIKYGKDPNVWTDNVDHFVLNLSDKFYYHDTVVYYGYLRGEETYNFVNEIIRRYEDYKNLIEE